MYIIEHGKTKRPCILITTERSPILSGSCRYGLDCMSNESAVIDGYTWARTNEKYAEYNDHVTNSGSRLQSCRCQ